MCGGRFTTVETPSGRGVLVDTPKWLRGVAGYTKFIETTPPPGGVPIYYVPSSRTVSKRTPLEAPGTNSSRGVLLLTVLDEGT